MRNVKHIVTSVNVASLRQKFSSQGGPVHNQQRLASHLTQLPEIEAPAAVENMTEEQSTIVGDMDREWNDDTHIGFEPILINYIIIIIEATFPLHRPHIFLLQ